MDVETSSHSNAGAGEEVEVAEELDESSILSNGDEGTTIVNSFAVSHEGMERTHIANNIKENGKTSSGDKMED